MARPLAATCPRPLAVPPLSSAPRKVATADSSLMHRVPGFESGGESRSVGKVGFRKVGK